MGCCNRRCRTISLFSLGTALLITGLLLALFWTGLYKQIVENELILANNSRSYKLWKETPIPMYLSIYLFNWTNADQVLSTKWAVKPNLQECGPYVFSEHHVRVNLKWNDNDTVSYRQRRTWHFEPNLSTGSLNDSITNLNPIVIIVGDKVKNMNFAIRELVNLALKRWEHSLVITKTVDELLFKGYEDKVLAELLKLNITNFDIPFTKFGWFYSRNNSVTYDGNFTMYTGAGDVRRVGIMNLWNGMNRTNFYKGHCGDVTGTTGELWPPVKDLQEVSIFSSDICSTLTIKYNNTEVIDNLTGNRYIATDYVYDNGTKYPEQNCFNITKTIPSGVRDMSGCRFGAPLYVSHPHFYLADPIYRNAVSGMRPNKTKHQFHITLEPNTGIPLDAHARLQINMFIEPIRFMSIFNNVKPTYLPMLWFSQTATLTNKYSSMVQFLLNLNNVGFYVGWSLFGVGLVFSCIAVLLMCRNDIHDQEEESLLENDQPES